MPSFTPVPWKPGPAPSLEGGFLANDRLVQAQTWHSGAEGPEDVIVDSDGSAIAGTVDGKLVRITPTGVSTIADVGGRPLGIEWYGADILVCNAHRGLQLVARNGSVTDLLTGFEGTPFRFTNNASVASDGTVYFTDTSTRWGLDEYVADLLEGQPTGRLFARTPEGEVTLLLAGLQFANGVALDAAERSVFVAETGRYRVHRHWLQGERAGTTDVFLDNLPGFPDNLTFGDGVLWVAFASPRQALVDMLLPRPWLRAITHRLPEAVKPKPLRHGMILGYDESGSLAHNLQDSSGRIAITTSARLHEGRLFVGSLTDPHVAVLELA